MADLKKEAFRKYLESAGAIDDLTRALVALYEEQARHHARTDRRGVARPGTRSAAPDGAAGAGRAGSAPQGR